MNFADLHEHLRLELLRRIDADILTGSRLAQQTGFRQAHISNFLNRKRALSLEGLDRVLASQNLTIHEILPRDDAPATISLMASAAPRQPLIETVPLVSPSVARNQPEIPPHSVLESIPISSALLYDGRPRRSRAQAHWRRFVALRVEARQAAAMEPILSAGCVVILDRHYTSLSLHRADQLNLYAVRCGRSLQLRFAEFDDNRLILRTRNLSIPVQLISIRPGQSPSDLIVGRVCLVLNEL